MNILIKQLRTTIFNINESISHNLDQYYQKISYANKYRYSSRLVYKSILYPPTLGGYEDYRVSARQEPNQRIRKLLGVKTGHPEKPIFNDEYSLDGPPKGRIYEKQPFKYTVEKGKVYYVCTCGESKNQPFCDGSHKIIWTTGFVKKTPKYRPIQYLADETKDVWFCNCKQSNNRPFCDGTHKTDQVKNGTSIKI